jgi:hypothetical protein
MCRQRNRININVYDDRAGFLPYGYATNGQRFMPEAYGPALYFPEPTRRTRCGGRSRRRRQRGGLVALLFGMIGEHLARRTLERDVDFESRDRPVPYLREEDKFEPRDRARMQVGGHRDDDYRRTVPRDESARHPGEPPSYEAVMKSG